MPKVDYAQVRTWMEHLEEDCVLEEQEEAVRGLIEYVQHDERREMSFLQRIFLGGDFHSFTRHNAACVVAALDDDIIEYYAPLCLDWLWDVNWPGAEIIFDRLTIARPARLRALRPRPARRMRAAQSKLYLSAMRQAPYGAVSFLFCNSFVTEKRELFPLPRVYIYIRAICHNVVGEPLEVEK